MSNRFELQVSDHKNRGVLTIETPPFVSCEDNKNKTIVVRVKQWRDGDDDGPVAEVEVDLGQLMKAIDKADNFLGE